MDGRTDQNSDMARSRDPDQESIYFTGSETTCYILSDESNICFYSASTITCFKKGNHLGPLLAVAMSVSAINSS